MTSQRRPEGQNALNDHWTCLIIYICTSQHKQVPWGDWIVECTYSKLAAYRWMGRYLCKAFCKHWYSVIRMVDWIWWIGWDGSDIENDLIIARALYSPRNGSRLIQFGMARSPEYCSWKKLPSSPTLNWRKRVHYSGINRRYNNAIERRPGPRVVQ